MQAQPVVIPIHNPVQNNTKTNGAETPDQAGFFESLLAEAAGEAPESPATGQNGSNQAAQAPEKTAPATEAASEAPAEEEVLPDENLVFLAPPPTNADAALSPKQLADQAVQLVDAIIAILEGQENNSAAPLNTDIVPLMQDLEQVLQQLDPALAEQVRQFLPSQATAQADPEAALPNAPLPPDPTIPAAEVQARMPIPPQQAENPQPPEQLLQFCAKLRGDLCPPENVNDTQPLPDLPPALRVINTKQSSEAKQEEPKPTLTEQGTPLTPATATSQPLDLSASRLQFTAKASAAALTRAVPQENLFDAMVERINMPLSDLPKMEIQLKPDHLGKVNIELALTDNGGLSAKILTSDEGVRNMLIAQVNRLSEALADKGIRVENIDIAYAPLADRGFDRPQGGQEQSRRPNARNLGLGALEEATTAYFEPYYDLDPLEIGLGLSSVEYRA